MDLRQVGFALLVCWLGGCGRAGWLSPGDDLNHHASAGDGRGDQVAGDGAAGGDSGGSDDRQSGDESADSGLPGGENAGDANAYGDGPPPFAFDETRVVPILMLTPNTVMIGFWPTGVPQSFHHYEVWYGTDLEQVTAAAPPASRQGPEQDPNLGALIMPAAQVVSRTYIVGLTPATSYFALVRALDWQAHEIARSAIRGFTTPAALGPGDAIDVFADASAPGSWVLPPEFGVTTDHPYAGTASLGIIAVEDSVLHYAGLAIPIAPLRTPAFASAYLELAIACMGGPSDYIELALMTTTGDSIWLNWPSYVICGPQYSVVQVPLTAFIADAGNAANQNSLTGDLAQFWTYGTWQPGPVYIDEIRLRVSVP